MSAVIARGVVDRKDRRWPRAHNAKNRAALATQGQDRQSRTGFQEIRIEGGIIQGDRWET